MPTFLNKTAENITVLERKTVKSLSDNNRVGKINIQI
jgi:hypothetical protein